MRLLPVILGLSLAAISYADIITLKNGRIVNGTYLGGTPRQIKVEVGDNIQTIDVGDIARIEFGGGGSTGARDSGPRDDGRPTLRRVDSDSGSDSGSSSSSRSGSSGSRPVILQPDPNDTGTYSSGSSLPADDSRPTLKRSSSSSSSDSSSSSSSTDDNKPTLRRAPDSSSPSTDSSSSSASSDDKPTLRRAPDSSSSSSSAPASSSSNDGDRPVLRRAATDASSSAPAPAPAPAAPTAAPAAKAPAPAPPPPVSIKLGQKQDDVVAALGQPDSVSAEGDKQIYTYASRSLKITFVNGKVSKVE